MTGRYLCAYRVNADSTRFDLAFTMMVYENAPVILSAVHSAMPELHWTEGFAQKPPSEGLGFLKSAVPK